MREGRIESRHSIKSLKGMRSSSHDLGAELRMHYFTINCDTFSNEEKVAVVVPVTSVEVTLGSCKFLYFVGKVFDEKTGKVTTMVNGWQYFRWMSICKCINYLLQFFTVRSQSYYFSVELTFS